MDAAAIVKRARDEARRRLARAAAHCANELKKTVSVPAPRVRSKSGRVRASAPAAKGAPPRKLTGRGRAGVAWKLLTAPLAAVVGVNVVYMPAHERKGHKWVAPTLARERAALTAILRGTA